MRNSALNLLLMVLLIFASEPETDDSRGSGRREVSAIELTQ